jgi:hypothetical protein
MNVNSFSIFQNIIINFIRFFFSFNKTKIPSIVKNHQLGQLLSQKVRKFRIACTAQSSQLVITTTTGQK